MTVREALARGKNALAGHETDTPDLDTSLLLSHVLGIDRAGLYMNLSDELPAVAWDSFEKAMKRRAEGEPVAWITGCKEFWGLEYSVGPGVLCPRPDSEVLIEEALVLMDRICSAETPGSESAARLHDCCTGPGTLALALKTERPDWDISASDISPDAQKFFSENNLRLTAGEVSYRDSDLMRDVEGPFDIIISNPPYLTPAETEDRRTLGWKEPVLAMDGGGNDGLDLIRRLIPEMFSRLRDNSFVLIEADPLQMPIIREILTDTGFTNIRIRQDLGERDRVIIAGKEKEHEG